MRTQYEVASQVGWKPRLFRTPYAEHSRATDDISLRLGLVEVFWNVDAQDDVPHAAGRQDRAERRARPASRGDHPPARSPSLDAPRAADDPAGDPAARPAGGVCAGAARDRSACARPAMPVRVVPPREARRGPAHGARLLVLAAASSPSRPRPPLASRREDADAEHLLLLRADQADDAGDLLCNITKSSYSRAEQEGCQARTGLDWHGFQLPQRGKARRLHRGRPVRHRPRHADVRRARLRPHLAFARLHVHVARDRAHVHERARPRPLPLARVVPRSGSSASLERRAGRRPSRAGGSRAPRRPRRAPRPAAALRCTSTTSRACTRR